MFVQIFKFRKNNIDLSDVHFNEIQYKYFSIINMVLTETIIKYFLIEHDNMCHL